MSNRLVALAALFALSLPSMAEASSKCDPFKGALVSATRFEAPVRVAAAPEVIRIIREERVAPRPPAKAPSINIRSVAPIAITESREAPRAATVSAAASPSQVATAELSGSLAEGDR